MIRFLHAAGYALWLGAQITFMVWGPASRRVGLEAWAHTWRTLGRIQRWVVAPAALVTTVTGVLIALGLYRNGVEVSGAGSLIAMEVLGLVAALLTLLVVTPLSSRVARLAEASLAAGAKDPRLERLRVWLAWAGSVSGVLLLAALWFGATRAAP